MWKEKKASKAEVYDEKLFEEGIFYMNSNQWLMAYLVFEKIIEQKKDKTVPTLYNFALCNFYAKKYKTTLLFLNEALMLLKFKVPSHESNNNTLEILLEDEYKNSHYKKALTASISELNQKEIKLRIRRLLIDTYLETENWQEILRLAKLTDMAKCDNVRIAFEKAELAVR